MRTSIKVSVVIAAVLLLVPASASAIKKSSTTVKLTGAEVDFGDAPEDREWVLTGALKSGARACVKGRSVRLTESGAAVGTSKSRANGSFVVRFPLEGNTSTSNYEATATKRRVGSRKRKRLCKPDLARMAFFRDETAVTIGFSDALDRFSGQLTPQHCASGNGWLLHAGSLANPIAAGSFDQQLSSDWSYDYGSQPPAGTYIVATGFQWAAQHALAGALNVGICPSAIAELTI